MRSVLIDLRGKRSLASVAREIGISHQMLSAIERGVRNPSIHVAGKISRFYGRPLEEIFFDLVCNDNLQTRKIVSSASC